MNRTGESMTVVDQWCRSRNRLLLLVHERPDGDALGAQLGLHLILSAAGHECVSFLSRPYPSRYEPLFGPTAKELDVFFGQFPYAISDFDGVIVLDTSNAKRTDTPESIPVEQLRGTACVIDHHYDNERFGEVNWVDSDHAATAQMIAEFAKSSGLTVSAAAATALLAGIMTDCGGFRFRNTTASVFRTAANLADCGAVPGILADALFFNEPYAKMRLKSKVLESAKFEFDGRFVYAVTTPELLDELGLGPADTEDVIDVIRAISGVEIACLMQRTPDGDMRLSFRSRSETFDVSELAHELGGGGHRLAAGARLENTPVERAVSRVVELVGGVLES